MAQAQPARALRRRRRVNAGASKELRGAGRSDRHPRHRTLKGLGAFPEPHELSLGMLGMHGTAYANYADHECDLLIAVGARFDDRVTGKADECVPQAKIIHIDVDPAEIGKIVPADVPIVGDAKAILPELLTEYRALAPTPADWKAGGSASRAGRQDYPLRYEPGRTARSSPSAMIEALYEATDGDAVVTSDVGQHQMWAAQYFKSDAPRQFITSGGLGTMGFGLPAAMGAVRPGPRTRCSASPATARSRCASRSDGRPA